MPEHKDHNSSKGLQLYGKLSTSINRVIRGQETAVRKLLAGFISGGHVLLEDYPGTGKTTLAKALARTLDLGFKRIQFTPDLMPADITGTEILQEVQTGRREFEFVKGPVFANIVLADEINRAPSKTQAA